MARKNATKTTAKTFAPATFTAKPSEEIDTHVVDGTVNLVGRSAEESSFVFRRVQTGLIQNYALLMLFGVFAFVSIYLLVR